MRHLLRPLRNQAPIPVIALKALPIYGFSSHWIGGFENGDEERRFCDGESDRFEELGWAAGKASQSSLDYGDWRRTRRS
nr:hypothetical protein Iba_chr15cCG8700 [Ipomoea batatas]